MLCNIVKCFELPLVRKALYKSIKLSMVLGPKKTQVLALFHIGVIVGQAQVSLITLIMFLLISCTNTIAYVYYLYRNLFNYKGVSMLCRAIREEEKLLI